MQKLDWEMPENRTLATMVLGGLLFFIPLSGIWGAWEEYRTVSRKLAGFRQENVILMKADLIEKKLVYLPAVIKNLFSFSSAPPSPPPEAVSASVPAGPSLGELFGNFRGRLEQQLNAVKIPEPPKLDLGKIRVRGFYRKKRVSQVLLWFEGKLLLVAVGDKIGGDMVVESCDFVREEITIRQIQTGAVHHLLVER